MPHHLLLLTVLCILVFCVSGNGVYAFGAGNIPGYVLTSNKTSIIHDPRSRAVSRIWRAKRSGMVISCVSRLSGRGDVSLTWSLQEDTLSEVAKRAGGFALGALIGRGGSKFGGLDIKRVYFGYDHSLERRSTWS